VAKRKGKSERRIKNWEQRYHASEEFEHVRARRQKFTRREVKLPPRELSAGAEDLDDLPRTEGMVVGHFPGGALVRVGREQLLCGIAGTFRAPEGASVLAVGDIATVALTRPEHFDGQDGIDKDRADGMILARAPRQTALSRPQPRSGKRRDRYETETFEKVIAANMDVVLIVAATAEPPLRHGLIDRFLIIAERGDLEPVLVINKIDLGPADPAVVESFRDLEVEILQCSALTGQGTEALVRRLAGKSSVLVGASGVGKSALINRIIPGADAATRAVRPGDERGRHTTSSAVVYDLPGGGIIVDTPGLRELGIHLDAAELPWYFPEFEALGGQCKFRDCTHTHEPGCAVVQAVERGEILARRYESYLNILATLADSTG